MMAGYQSTILFLVFIVITGNTWAKRFLPSGPLNMGYVSSCDPDKINHAVKTGLNVLFWFSIDLVDTDGKPGIVPNPVQPLPDLACIAKVAALLQTQGYQTSHLVTVGGWGAIHPVTIFSAADMWENFKEWNQNVVARAGFPTGFDGIDWDLEGANNATDPANQLPVAVLDLVGQISQLAQSDGFIVSMVPPESYLDPTTSLFDSSLLHPYPEWEHLVTFNYHGHNGYAYLIAKYGKTACVSCTEVIDTFDIVSIQVYETYSHMDYNLTAAATLQSASNYLSHWIPRFQNGWYVDFASDPSFGLPSQVVFIKKTALCIGLANGWADNTKTVLVLPAEAGLAYNALLATGMEPRGFVFWNVDSEGQVPPGHKDKLFMAAGINAFLHTRNMT